MGTDASGGRFEKHMPHLPFLSIPRRFTRTTVGLRNESTLNTLSVGYRTHPRTLAERLCANPGTTAFR